MEEIKNAILERVNNRFLGAFLLAFAVSNYEALSVFFLGSYDIVEKLQYISKTYSDIRHLLLFPFAYAFFYVLAVPWLTHWVERYTNVPNYYREIERQKHQLRILEIEKMLLKGKQEVAEIEVNLKEKEQKLNQHDISMFKKHDSLLSEVELLGFINNVKDNQRCQLDTTSKLDRYIDSSNLSSNRYLSQELERLHRDFVSSLSILMSFISQHFFVELGSPPDKPIIALYPEKRHEPIFRDHAMRLAEIANDVYGKYTKYRTQIKSNLEL